MSKDRSLYTYAERKHFSLLISMVLFGFSGYCTEPESFYKKELSSFVYGELDYLLWFTNQNGFRSPSLVTGKSPDLGSKWSSGGRGTIGFRPSYCDIRLSYSYYSNSVKAGVECDTTTVFSFSPSTSGIFSVQEHEDLRFNRIDWEVGKDFRCTDCFLFRPFFGLQGLGTKQTFDPEVRTVFLDLTTGDPAVNIANAHNTNSFLSLGARVGFEGDLRLGAGFSAFGNFAANILWGRFNIRQHYSQTEYFSSGSPTVLADQTRKITIHDSIFNYDLGIGFDWRRYFPKKDLELVVKLGWEQHYYADMVRFRDFAFEQTGEGSTGYCENGNLTLSGCSFGVLLRY